MINDQACKKDHLKAEMGLFPSAELVNFFSVVVMGQVERKIKLLILGYTFFEEKSSLQAPIVYWVQLIVRLMRYKEAVVKEGN